MTRIFVLRLYFDKLSVAQDDTYFVLRLHFDSSVSLRMTRISVLRLAALAQDDTIFSSFDSTSTSSVSLRMTEGY